MNTFVNYGSYVLSNKGKLQMYYYYYSLHQNQEANNNSQGSEFNKNLFNQFDTIENLNSKNSKSYWNHRFAFWSKYNDSQYE